MEFPFNEPENTAVFTCSHVMEKGEDICYVTHDEDDGAWQFLCDRKHPDISEARLVALREIWELDATVGELATMACGCRASRKNRRAKWQIR